MRRLAGSLVGLMLIAGLALPAWANHPPTTDSGVDVPNTGSAMNQPSFWETYFDGDGYSVDCAKFSNHNGSIPAQYEAAVVKSGSDLVRVYVDPPAQVIGPANPNQQHPNRRHQPPFSWVMKCNFIPDLTTTTQPEETTTSTSTTLPEESTTTTGPTTTVPESSTTTTTPESTTSVTPSTSPSTTLPAPSTSAPGPSSTVADEIVDPVTLEMLPFTGIDHDRLATLLGLGGVLTIAGVLVLIAARSWKDRSE